MSVDGDKSYDTDDVPVQDGQKRRNMTTRKQKKAARSAPFIQAMMQDATQDTRQALSVVAEEEEMRVN